jgi:hypothetical protein
LLVAAGLLAVGPTGCSDEPEAPARSTGATTTTTPVLTPDAIPVLRAAEPIPAGTEAGDALAAGLIEDTTVTRDLFPVDGAVTLELIEGRVALTDIAAGTLLTLGLFGAPGENGSTPAGAGVESDEDG